MTGALTRIKADVLGRPSGTESTTSSLLSASKYNIADIFRELKPEDACFLKYVPDGFLSGEQKEAKQKAIVSDLRKIEVLKYQERDELPTDRELLMNDLSTSPRSVLDERTGGRFTPETRKDDAS